jgi:hypothetical protein
MIMCCTLSCLNALTSTAPPSPTVWAAVNGVCSGYIGLLYDLTT